MPKNYSNLSFNEFPIILFKNSSSTAKSISLEDIFSNSFISKWFSAKGLNFYNRVFDPLTTLWVFLGQCLLSDKSCRHALIKFNALRLKKDLRPCSLNTAAYVKARKRLPVEIIKDLTREVGRRVQEKTQDIWNWKGMKIKLLDGTVISMPDTRENQKTFPQTQCQKKGAGFPLARLVVETSLTAGVLLDARLAPWKGKGTGETTLFRSMLDRIEEGDLLIYDQNFTGFFDSYLALKQGANFIGELKNVQKRGLSTKKKS